MSGVFDRDWRRLSRWCFAGVLVMCVWLLVPVGKCSYHTFRDIPLDEEHPTAPLDGDRDHPREDHDSSFFGSWISSIRTCYARTPLMGQEAWKSNLLVGLLGAMVLTWGLHRMTRKAPPRLS